MPGEAAMESSERAARDRTRAHGWRFTVLLALAGAMGCGPMGPIPGGRLGGSVEPAPDSWAFTADVETVQLETRPDDPHSVNAWCGAWSGSLYLPTSLILGVDDPAEREWVQNVLADPRVRIRINGKVYERRAVRVEDPAEREGARRALLEKYEVEADPHADAAWVFRLDPR